MTACSAYPWHPTRRSTRHRARQSSFSRSSRRTSAALPRQAENASGVAAGDLGELGGVERALVAQPAHGILLPDRIVAAEHQAIRPYALQQHPEDLRIIDAR